MTTSLRQKIALSLALGLAVAIIALGGLSFQRKLVTFKDLGVELSGTGRSGQPLRVTGVDRDLTSDLRVGDQLLLVNGTTASSQNTLRRALREERESEIVLLRGEGLETISYVRPGLELDWSYLVQAFIGAIYLLIGLFTVVREPNRQSRLFFLWCATSSAFYILVSTPAAELTIDSFGRTIYLVEEFTRLLLPPLTLHFFLAFPKRLAEGAVARRLVPFVYLPSAVLATLQADLIFENGRLLLGSPQGAAMATTIGLLDRAEILLFVVYAIAAAGILVHRSAGDILADERRQLLWIALGMGVGYLPFLVFYFIPWTLGLQAPMALEVLAVAPLAVVPLTFAYAILRYRLWDITIIARDVATYTLTLLFGILGFSVLRLFVEASVPETAVASRNVLNFAAAILIGGLLVPARHRIGSTLQRVYYRSGYNKRRALADLGRELLHERDLENLCRLLLEQLEDALALDKTNLLLAEGDRFVSVRFDHSAEEAPSVETLGDEFWKKDVQVLSGIGLPEGGPTPAQQLFAAGYRFAFPLLVRERRVGALVCGDRYDEAPLSSEDQDLIRQVLNQAALAIENAHLLDRLHLQLRELRELKQYNESIVEATPAGIAVLDGNDEVVSANFAFAALCGREPRSLRGSRLQSLLPLDRIPTPQDGVRELALSVGRDRKRHLQVSVAKVSSMDGDLRVLVATDITERVAMERDLEEKGRLAALGAMAAGIAHEVNTPLTGISSYAQMLLQSTDQGDPRYALLEKVERQTFRASRIVNNLLSLARNQAGEPTAIALEAVVNECLELLGPRIEDSNITVTTEIESGLPPVLAAEGELQQVFNNLLVNAVDAMPGGGTLSIRAHRDRRKVVVEVKDDGPGIPVENRERIFEPFFSTKHDEGGTGLGLSISAEILRRNGGALSLAENHGRSTGCRFIVSLAQAETS